jgi:hypothetical protein
MITVYCADSSHAERRWDIAQFAQVPGTSSWVKRPSIGPDRLSGSNRVSVRLDGDDYLTREQPSSADRHIRYRYTLHCKLCGLSVSRRADTLHPVLDKLAEAGVNDVSMKALAALHCS